MISSIAPGGNTEISINISQLAWLLSEHNSIGVRLAQLQDVARELGMSIELDVGEPDLFDFILDVMGFPDEEPEVFCRDGWTQLMYDAEDSIEAAEKALLTCWADITHFRTHGVWPGD